MKSRYNYKLTFTRHELRTKINLSKFNLRFNLRFVCFVYFSFDYFCFVYFWASNEWRAICKFQVESFCSPTNLRSNDAQSKHQKSFPSRHHQINLWAKLLQTNILYRIPESSPNLANAWLFSAFSFINKSQRLFDLEDLDND